MNASTFLDKVEGNVDVDMVKSVLTSRPAQSFYKRCFHKLLKLFTHKKPIGIVCEDYTRKQLQLDVDDSKYLVMNLESIARSMHSDRENTAIDRLKVENLDMYILKEFEALKGIMSALQSQYKKKIPVVLLSSLSMAERFKIKNLMVFQMDKELYTHMVSKAPDNQKSFLAKHRKMHLPHATMIYSSLNQLKVHILRNLV